MAEIVSYGLGPGLDFEQLMSEACHRWLRPAEICEILRNYQKFHITPDPPNRPPSGSLFLFDRKVLRYFRKDGHNWRKKKDGKTVKEAHEKLKVGSVDALHCYYAHGEENENFQRRSYWLLEEDFMHIVFVHYLEVKGNKTNIGGIRVDDEDTLYFKNSPSSSGLPRNYSTNNSGNADLTSPTSTLTSLCEDADSEDVQLVGSRLQSPTGPSNVNNNHVANGSYEDQSKNFRVNHSSHIQTEKHRGGDNDTYAMKSQRMVNSACWSDARQQCPTNLEAMPLQTSDSSTELVSAKVQSNWQITLEDHLLQLADWPADETLNTRFTYDPYPGFFEQSTDDSSLQNTADVVFTASDQEIVKPVPEIADSQCEVTSNLDLGFSLDGNCNLAFTSRKLSLNDEGLQKADSFSRWITRELGDVEDLNVQSTSEFSWNAVECGTIHDESSLSPSLSQHQLFSIIDFTPKWAYTDSVTEVFIYGTFLESQPEVSRNMWSCMFGEVEVPAEILADGVLCCHVPSHEVGRVPFYITCSNRLSCSEIREFEYQEGSANQLVVSDVYGSHGDELLLCSRFERLLSLRSISPCNHVSDSSKETRDLIIKIIALMEEECCCLTFQPNSENLSSEHDLRGHLLQKFMKDRFCSWLLHKVTEDDQRPSVLDAKGQGVIHLAAALGYYWAIKPLVVAGVSINFRDVNGWTALHWAAFYGREQTVAVLLSLGAAPGALTDPSPEHPLSRTPADLASENGHKGISGFLAETSLTSYLSTLKIEDSSENVSTQDSGSKAVLTVAEKAATPISHGDVPAVLSLKDSLTAVCNAKQAADRIYQVFRMQSFQRKQLQLGYDNGSLDEHALSLLAAKTRKPGQNDWLANSAATKIQKKFRGWQKRKEFLIIRQRIIKIQAHVRGHQVRKQYKPIVWSVGILEKVILRWRRRGSGLRGFRQDNREPSSRGITSKDDDYDFLKEGRRQTEERFQKALTRVKSMVQYPEARDQYRRLLTVVEGIRETKACDMVLSGCEEATDGEVEDMIDIGPLLDDDAFMSTALNETISHNSLSAKPVN